MDTISRRIQATIATWLTRPPLRGCLVKDNQCSGPAVQAHSVQRAGALKALTSSGHVYMFEHRVGSGFELIKTGIREATTFTGFCEYHDREIFREIDFGASQRFDAARPRQAMLFCFRSVACEYWKKLNARALHQQLFDLQHSEDIKGIQRLLNVDYATAVDISGNAHTTRTMLANFDFALRRLRRWFASLRSQLKSNRFHLSKHELFEIPGPPTVAAACVFTPWFDITGRAIRKLVPHGPQHDVALNVFPDRGVIWVSFVYHRNWANHLSQFFRALRECPAAHFPLALSKVLVLHSENLVLAPALVDTFTPTVKRALCEAFDASIARPLPLEKVPDVNLFGVRGTAT